MIPVMEEQASWHAAKSAPTVFQRMIAGAKRLGSVVVGRSEIGVWSRTA
jgi:hypothetical protein